MRIDVTSTAPCPTCGADVYANCTRTIPAKVLRFLSRNERAPFAHAARITAANRRWRFLLNHPDHRGTIRPAVIHDADTAHAVLEMTGEQLWAEHMGRGYNAERAS